MIHRATCTDCQWAYRSESHEAVSDALERHARKEHHHVQFTRTSPATA